MPEADEEILSTIFEGIILGFLKGLSFNEKVVRCGSVAVAATIEMYNTITAGLLPIPAKFHYTFNLRDISKVFQGILMTKPKSISDDAKFINLWIHETSRVFHD